MSRQGFRSPYPNNQDPPIVNQTEVASTEEKILWDPAGLAPQTAIPANSLYAGQVLKVTAWGVFTTVAEASKTATFKARYGTTVSGTEIGASIAQPVNNAALTTKPFLLELFFQVRSVGSSGTATCGGAVYHQGLVGTAATTNTAPVTFGTASTSATTINTTTASGLLVTVTNSVATNKWTTLGVIMESLN